MFYKEEVSKRNYFCHIFCTKLHYSKESDRDTKFFDVVFIGHYAADGRADYIDALVKAGVNIKVFGKWQEVAIERNWPKDIVSGNVYNDAYRDTIASAKIALCFLSKKNADGYTRRCFEIPAIGTLLLSEFTIELSELFLEDQEAVFFRSPEELVNKVNNLLNKPEEIVRISTNGHKKVLDFHSEKERVKMFLSDIQTL